MKRSLLISAGPGEVRAALVEDGAVVELGFARAHAPSLVGAVFLGRVVRRLPELAAVLVDIGGARPGFLPARARQLPNEGEAVLVQVERDGFAGKAPRLTRTIVLTGDRVVLRPGGEGLETSRRLAARERQRLIAIATDMMRPGEGVVLRTEAAGADAAALADEIAGLRARWAAILAAADAGLPPRTLLPPPEPLPRLLEDLARPPLDAIRADGRSAGAEARRWLEAHRPGLAGSVAVDELDLFEREGIEEAIDNALARELALPGGGRLVIDETAAATLIDVDSGMPAGRGGSEAALQAVNTDAARAAAHALRLRNIGGAVVIDFIGVRGAPARQRVQAVLAQALARDPVPSDILGWTHLGHLELTRQRRRTPLADLLLDPVPARHKNAETVALAALRRAERTALARRATALSLAVRPDAAAALDGPLAPARAELARRLGLHLTVRPLAAGGDAIELDAGSA